MEFGVIGLGRMGANMAERLVRGGHRVIELHPELDETRDVVGHGLFLTRPMSY